MNMLTKILTALISVSSVLVSVAAAQESSLSSIRAVLHDPSNHEIKFYVGKPGEAMEALKLVEEGLGEPQKVQVTNGSINLFSSAAVNPANPQASLLASIKVPSTAAASLIVIILPSPKGGATSYSGIAISDDPKSFPWGQSKAVNLTPVEFAIEVGEHKLPLPAGKITDVPKVEKVNEYHRAQTNFYYKQDNQWVIAAERQMQYLNTLRRIFLVSKAPNALSPDVRTIVDQPPVNMEGKKP